MKAGLGFNYAKMVKNLQYKVDESEVRVVVLALPSGILEAETAGSESADDSVHSNYLERTVEDQERGFIIVP